MIFPEPIPTFLQEKLDLSGYSKTDKFPPEIKEFMVRYASHYEWNVGGNLKNILNIMRQKVTVLPICGVENCEKPVKFDYYMRLTAGCCTQHNQILTSLKNHGVDNPGKSAITVQRRKETNLKRYGHVMPPHADGIKQQVQKTLIERYGVDCALKSPEIREKIRQTNLIRYGVEHPYMVGEIRDRIKNTMALRYGACSPMQVPELKAKIIKTTLDRYGVEFFGSSDQFLQDSESRLEKRKLTYIANYGVDHPMKSLEIKEKYQQTCIEKYGVRHHMMVPEICEKQQNSMISRREYIWKTGDISSVQGYEPMVLHDLEENGYGFSDVKTMPSDMPPIWYWWEGTNHRYYPDIYIESENLIIEVKSKWTYDMEIEKNQSKFKAVEAAGFKFKLIIKNRQSTEISI